jgi:hypothetical protein
MHEPGREGFLMFGLFKKKVTCPFRKFDPSGFAV